MKRAAILSAAILAAGTTRAALPTLSGLADALTSLTTRFEDTTNRLATLTARFDEATNRVSVLQTRLEAATNLLGRLEAAINTDSAMRKAYHGTPTHSLTTNEVTRIIQRLEQYPDGYEYVVPGMLRKAYTPEEAAEIAARRKNAKQMRIDFLRDNIERLLVEGAKPATTDEEIAAAAMARINAKKYQKSLDRLLAQQSTNTVDVVVTPQTPNP